MKRNLLFTLALSLSTLGLMAQTIVSTSAENRKVVLEEFTGIYCGFCPDGHAIAQSLQDNNPGDVFLINVHQGGYANPNGNDPDFRTPWGDAIAGQTDLAGYPAGTINRSNFPGMEMGSPGTTALGRNNWNAAANIIMGESSYVNLAVEATVDIPTNSINIHVEGYYTADSPVATNLLNVAVLQNNTLGPQSGGGQGNNYNHQHRLIDLVTGQWGEEITTTTQGSFIDRTYQYTLPGSINGVYIDHNELDLVVYMTEDSQNIISGNEGTPTVNPLVSNNDTSLLEISELNSACNATSVAPEVTILNSGLDAITSLNFTYSVNGGATQDYNWTGNIASLETAVIQLDDINYTSQALNTVDVSIENDDFNENNNVSTTFDGIIESAGSVELTITTDQYADEISWEFLGSDGTVLESESLNAGDNNQTLTFNYSFPDDCITFNINDSYGDGILGGGGVSVIDNNGVEIYPFFGNYSEGATKPFNSDGILGLGDFNITSVAIYPNPANDIINIVNAENSTIEVYDVLGKLLISKEAITAQEQLNISQLQIGTYFMKINNGSQSATKKLIKQ